MKMETIYEDSDILVINKPPGLVIDRSTMETEGRLVVHRLDKDTSGLLIFAKTAEALENLQRQFKKREVKKGYLALVHGLVETPLPCRQAGRRGVCTIDKPIGRAPKGVGKFVVRLADQLPRSAGRWREAVTKYSVVAASGLSRSLREPLTIINKLRTNPNVRLDKPSPAYTLLEVEPLTGRTHQIRVHLKFIGHPVVGDKIYASRRQQKEDEKIIKRQFLHAYRLGFEHPRTGEWMMFEVGLAEDLKEVLRRITQ